MGPGLWGPLSPTAGKQEYINCEEISKRKKGRHVAVGDSDPHNPNPITLTP